MSEGVYKVTIKTSKEHAELLRKLYNADPVEECDCGGV